MMQVQRIVGAIIIAGLMTATFTSCKKYENGGLVGKAEKRLTANTWKLDKYLRNGNDATSTLVISNFTEQFQEGGVLIRNYIDKDGDPFSETGSWQFDNDKEQVNLTGVGSLELSDQNSTVSTSDYNIIKLKKKELWYTYDNGGDNHEFHFIPN